MNKYLYKKGGQHNLKKILRFAGLGMLATGIIFGLYMFFPLISWKVYIEPVFASTTFASPIPKTNIITKDYLRSLLESTAQSMSGRNYSDLQNWFPSAYKETQTTQQIASYSIAIPKISIDNAAVTTVDNDLSRHLVHFPDTALPPNKGNAAIFGHSTLPQLFNPKDYKTIFANAHNLKIGDKIIVYSNSGNYTYIITSIHITDAEDTSYLAQDYSDSYLTLITCTPPGTIWKRLIIKSKLERI